MRRVTERQEVPGWVADALGEATFGDRRRRERVLASVAALAARPGSSISAAHTGDWAATMGTYRLLDNEHVTVEALVGSIGAATGQRAAGQDTVVVIQDTTVISPHAPRRVVGLGAITQPESHGLLLHTTLAATLDGVPVGVLHQSVWTREADAPPRRAQRYQTPIEGKESVKWLDGLLAARQHLGTEPRLLVVADREADLYDLYALAAEQHLEVVQRVAQDRVIAEPPGRLGRAAAQAPVLARAEVAVRRSDERPARTATVEVRATAVTILPPTYPGYQAARRRWWAAHPEATPRLSAPPGPLRLHLVEVVEPSPPAGVTPLHWRLLTTLPSDTAEAVLTVVALYTLRWCIERFHYVLKSGCAIERLQLETPARWMRASVLLSLVAWRVLWLTEIARAAPDAPADTVLPAAVWQVLGVQLHGVVPEQPPTLATVVAQIGALGGHLGRASDGPPGVKTLWRGMRRLHDLLAFWDAVQPLLAQPRSVER